MSGRVLVLLALLAACGGGSSSAPDAAGDDQPIDAAPPDGELLPPDGGPQTGVVQCPTPLPAPTDGVCDVVEGTAGVVVWGNVLGLGVTYLDGAVVYENDRITYVGCDPVAPAATVITCAGAAISPGLINAHDHITFDENAPNVDDSRFLNRNQWRSYYPTPPNDHGADGTRWVELRQVFAGTTSNLGSGGTAGMLRNLDSLRTDDYDLGFDPVRYETFILNDQNVNTAPANCGWNYEYTEEEVAYLPALFNHASEGLDVRAHEEFRCVRSSFAGARDFVERNTSHVHIIAGNAEDFYDMARDDTELVWSPRSNLSLFGNTTAAQVMHALGGTVAVGTDWTYSGSGHLLRELACVDSFDATYLNDYFTDEDVWRMVTINAAIATGTDDLIGSLEVGKVADLAVFRADPGETYRAIIEGQVADVALVVRDGDVLYGEDDVVGAIDAGCEALTICGGARRLCTTRELGMTYDALQALVPGAYDAEICAAPVDEPTCVPSRPTEYDGVISGSNPDGDGVATANDNCPDVFNPIRAIDAGEQADVDGDGVGDACDPTPVGDDLDGDTTPNAVDVCPFNSDDQTDTDGDGKGDACDACPDVPNPVTVCLAPPTSIVDIQDGTITPGTSVHIVGAVVTGVAYNGFSIQDPTVTSGEYAGVFVFTFDPPTVAIGEIVEVSGPVTEFFGMTEIGGPAPATIIDHVPGGTLPAPIAVTAAEAVDERWEAVLVTISGITEIEDPYTCACSGDTNMFRINQTIVGWDAMWEGTTTEWTTEVDGIVPGDTVTGVMFYRFDARRVMPRLASDL